MRVFIITDLEGTAGVTDAPDWIYRKSRYYENARKLLTDEVNAAIEGFCEAGADKITVCDGHGEGGINGMLLDERASLLRGFTSKPYPFGLEGGYDCVAWVGQHPKSRAIGGHICHTGNFDVFEVSINGIPVGEFGELAYCALELGVVPIFGAGDLAFTKEAEELLPGIGTVWVKEGRQTEAGDNCTAEEYEYFNTPALHKSPALACSEIKIGAYDALTRFKNSPETFSRRYPDPPYVFECSYRIGRGYDEPRTSRAQNPKSIIDLLNG